MEENKIKIKKIWETICKEVQVSSKKSPYMRSYFQKKILSHGSLEDALAHNIAEKVCDSDFELGYFISILQKQISNFLYISDYAVEDLIAL